MVNLSAALVCFLIFAGIAAADLRFGILRRPALRAFFLFFLSHPLLLTLWGANLLPRETAADVAANFVLMFTFVVFLLYYYIRLHFSPAAVAKVVSVRARLLMGGRCLLGWSVYGGLIQILYIKFHLQSQALPALSHQAAAADWVFTILTLGLLLANGFFRIFILSSRLRLVRRIFIMATIWFPVVNLFTLYYMRRIAQDEYDHELNKAYARHTRKEREVCQTRYPLLMLHGVGFRDFKYLNYWGRIPRELTRNGAVIYYGNQEACGTVKHNAEDVKRRIQQILADTGAEKVNIIAHSKGGLDARWSLQFPEVRNKVASVTTISSPHRGCRMANITYNMPQGLYQAIGKAVNWYFRKIGDENPDFCTAVRQFSTIYSQQFNQECPDVDNVYYQSYMSVMKHPASDLLLCLPYCVVRLLEGPNDGLVSVSSAKWGQFRQLYQNRRRRGISHGDMIDLKRQDYRGFDVVEAYVGIVAELKEMGY